MTKITFLTRTLGCRVNQAETKQIVDELTSLGYCPSRNQQLPDIIILNTCVITQKGERESVKTIHRLKKQYPNSFLLVTGCAVNLWLSVKRETKSQKLPGDLFVPNERKNTISQIITKRFPLSPQIPDLRMQKPSPNPGSNKRVFVKVQDGCDHFCAYCIVPHIRTRPSSKNPNQIIEEIKQANQKGVKEAILCGINLSLYGQDLDSSISLNYLIKNILEKTSISRLSLSSLTPRLANQELINIFIHDQKKDKRLSTYWHLALQSGSTAVLKRMNRQTNLKKLKKILQYIKEEVPCFTLRADIMIGFPQETEQEFNQTLQFIKNTGISFIHSFRFSPRPNTTAQKMIDKKQWSKIPENIKKNRQKKLLKVAQDNRQKQAQNLIGSTKMVLILKKIPGNWWGLSDNYWPVIITNNKTRQKSPLGKIIPVKITNFEDKILRGNFINSN